MQVELSGVVGVSEGSMTYGATFSVAMFVSYWFW